MKTSKIARRKENRETLDNLRSAGWGLLNTWSEKAVDYARNGQNDTARNRALKAQLEANSAFVKLRARRDFEALMYKMDIDEDEFNFDDFTDPKE